MPLIFLRSLAFQIVWTLNCIFWFTFAIVGWVLPTAGMVWMARVWGVSSVFLHELITGARVSIRGIENIPEGPCIVAAKHQSAWETMGLVPFFPRTSYIFKRELLWVPLFGWHMLKAGQVPINRGDRNSALESIERGVKRATEKGAHIMIFPEGTRRKVGAPPAYRFGVARIYRAVNSPCVPVAVLSGLAWPRNTFIHKPRPIIVEFLPPIPAGLEAGEFFETVQKQIEDKVNALMVEVGEKPSVPPPQASA